MSLEDSKLYQLIKGEVAKILNESAEGLGKMTVHPFDNHLAHMVDRTPQENLYDELADACVMKMVAVYDEDQVRDIIRPLAKFASQGPGSIGGQFRDEEIESILTLVFEKIEEKTGVNLASHMPEDREHPRYMDME